jgi:hypothetical protein
MGNDNIPRTSDQIVIATLALSENELIERVTELEADNRWLRETLRVAVGMLHRTNVQLDRAKRVVLELRAALRDARDERAA